jgi:hypothetical protein
MYNYGEYDGVLGKFTFQGSGEPVIYPVVVMVKDGGAVPYKE